MIESIVKKIMITGINKYAKAYELTPDKVQIKVTNDPSGTVFYTICNNFKAVENVRFIDIMDKKFDIFQYETLANPFLKKSLSLYADETNDNIENVCSFIMQVNNNNNVGLAFYNGYKNGKNISLGKHLSELGL
jgi:hypothetical protein